VDLIMPPGKKLDHNGIMVKFFGRIDMVSMHSLYRLVCVEFWHGYHLLLLVQESFAFAHHVRHVYTYLIVFCCCSCHLNCS
jgi:hypothetical protein